jgi:hypothetical protein
LQSAAQLYERQIKPAKSWNGDFHVSSKRCGEKATKRVWETISKNLNDEEVSTELIKYDFFLRVAKSLDQQDVSVNSMFIPDEKIT